MARVVVTEHRDVVSGRGLLRHPRSQEKRENEFYEDMHSFIATMAQAFPIDLAITVGHPAMIASARSAVTQLKRVLLSPALMLLRQMLSAQSSSGSTCRQSVTFGSGEEGTRRD